MAPDRLGETLEELALKLRPSGVQLIIGGGYGLVLRGRLIAIDGRWPRYGLDHRFRSTDDLDCFLGADVITEPSKTETIATALRELGFNAVEPHWIFQKSFSETETVKIDLLAASVPPDMAHLVRQDTRRIRPRSSHGLHARSTPEAITVHQNTTVVVVSANGSGATVLVPHPLSFVLMKLFAFRDRVEKPDDDFGAYHAFDILMVLSTISAAEWDQALEMVNDDAVANILDDARRIVEDLFGSPTAIGMIRLVSYAKDRQATRISPEAQAEFRRDLHEIFGLHPPS